MIKVDAIEPAGSTLTLGNVTADSISVDSIKDSGGNVLVTSDGSGNLTGAGDSVVLLSTATASDSASIEFTLPTDYKQVTFKIINMAPAASSYPQFQVSTGGSFDTTVTSTAFNAYHYSTGSVSGMNYRPSESQAQGTNYQDFGGYIGSQSERCGCIALTLANPSSDTFVKHWWARSSSMNADGTPYALQDHIAGYWNTSSPLTSISFICSDGNISSGTIKMWGIK